MPKPQSLFETEEEYKARMRPFWREERRKWRERQKALKRQQKAKIVPNKYEQFIAELEQWNVSEDATE